MAISDVERAAAEAEELMLIVADNKTGYFGVYHLSSCPAPSPTRRR